jgi:hypothetical protein
MLKNLAFVLALLLSTLAFVACEPSTGDYVEITGGGFLFNYRIAEATYGLVATARRTVPPGTVFVAGFENPEGGEPLVVELVSQEKQRRFAISSPPIKGVVVDTPYTVTLELRTPEGVVMETHETTYTSKVGSDVLPDKPLTIGPGYTKNPEATE